MTDRILYIYDETSVQDVAMRQELEGWLYTLHRERHHTTRWHTLLPGDDLRAERERYLTEADVILLLVSVDFVRSDACYALAEKALEQRQRGARVVPILLRPVASWETLPFGGIQPLPRDGRPVSHWESREDAWRHISVEIRALLAELGQRRQAIPAARPTEPPGSRSRTRSPGARFGSYRVYGHLGAGGTGYIYEAMHEMTKKRVAIKTCREEAPTGLIEWEALALGLAWHPGVVDIYDAAAPPDAPAYIVMELLSGMSLDASRRELDDDNFKDHDTEDTFDGALPLRTPHGPSRSAGLQARSQYAAETLQLIWQVATTMTDLHARGIVHCDLKPYNMIVCKDPLSSFGKRVKIFDFGLALLTGEDAPPDLFPESSLIGTPLYMSPEQMSAGRSGLTSKTDVYTLGVTLFERLTGRLPFSGGLAEIVALRGRNTPPPLEWLKPSVPVSVIDLVRWMLERAPGARPSMAEVAAGLAEARAHVTR